MPLYEFRCPSGHTSERVRPIDTADIACPECGDPAERSSGVYRVSVAQPEVDTRGMYRRFTEVTAEMDHSATRIEQNTGTSVATPNLWVAAKAKAAAMIAAREA